MPNKTLAELNRLAPSKVVYRHPFSGDAASIPGMRLGTNAVRFNTVPRGRVSDISNCTRDMAASPSVIVAVGDGSASGGTTTVAASSTDGAIWTARTLSATAAWCSVIWTGVRFLATADATTVSSVSTDGATWTAGPTMPAAGLRLYAFAGLLVAFSSGSGTAYYTSADDGATWTTRTFPATIAAGYGRIGVAATAGAMVVVVGTAQSVNSSASWANVVYRSTNGTSWTAQTLPNSAEPVNSGAGARLLSSNSRFCLLYYASTGGAPLYCSTSADGVTWEAFQSIVPVGVDGGHGNVASTAGNQLGAVLGNNTYFTQLSAASRGNAGAVMGTVATLTEYDPNGGSAATRITIGWLHTIDGNMWTFERALLNTPGSVIPSYAAATSLPAGDGFAFGFMNSNSGGGSFYCRTNPNFKEFTYVE